MLMLSLVVEEQHALGVRSQGNYKSSPFKLLIDSLICARIPNAMFPKEIERQNDNADVIVFE